MAGNYPAGVTDDDPHFTDETGYEITDECRASDHFQCARPISCDCDCHDETGLHHCPFCDHDGVTDDHIRICSGYKPTGMPPNENGHPYGCGCSDCMSEYQRLK